MPPTSVVASSCSAVGLVLVLVGCTVTGPAPDAGTGSPRPDASSPAARATVPPAPTPAPAPVPSAAAVPRSSAGLDDQPSAETVAPTRVVVPSLDIDVPVSPEGIDAEGALALPADPEVASWYRFGPSPASPRGTTVVAAHVDSVRYGIGPFSRLATAPVGTTVTVASEDGSSVDYVVERVELAPKTGIDWSQVFDREGEPRLVLVTCGGDFDRGTGHYVSNVIVTAARS